MVRPASSLRDSGFFLCFPSTPQLGAGRAELLKCWANQHCAYGAFVRSEARERPEGRVTIDHALSRRSAPYRAERAWDPRLARGRLFVAARGRSGDSFPADADQHGAGRAAAVKGGVKRLGVKRPG